VGIDPSPAKFAALILETLPHPEQGYRACLGIPRLARQHGVDRLEAAGDPYPRLFPRCYDTCVGFCRRQGSIAGRLLLRRFR
jgi:hypothetical protein